MMDYEMDGEDEKAAPYDSVISEDSLSTNRDSFRSDLAGPSRQSRKMEELFPWIIPIDNEFRYILKISWCRRRLLVFMTKYIQVIRDNLPTFIHFPNRCFVMARYMSKCMFLFKELFNSFADSNEYLVRICEMLITYTLLELKHAVKFNTSKTSIADRIGMNYDIHLKSADISYLLRVFMELPTFFQQKEVMSKIFEKYLKKPESFVKKELPDKLFVMYIVAYKLWRSVESDDFAKDKIDNIAHRYMYPKNTLQKNRRYAPFLPNYETVEDAAITILKKSFSLVGLVSAIKAEDMDINPENVIDLSEETRALSIVVDDDEETETVDNDVNVKREAIEINQTVNDPNAGENRHKFEVEWIDFFIKEAIEAEPMAIRLPSNQPLEILDTIILDESDDEDAQIKLPETAATDAIESSEKTPDVVQIDKVAQIDTVTQIDKVAQIEEVAQMAEVAQTEEVDQMAEVAQIAEVNQIAEVAQIPEIAQIPEVVTENHTNDFEDERVEIELSSEPLMDNNINIVSTNDIINEIIVETTEEVETTEDVDGSEASKDIDDIITSNLHQSTNNTDENIDLSNNQNKTKQNVNNYGSVSVSIEKSCDIEEVLNEKEVSTAIEHQPRKDNSVYSEETFFDHTSIDHNYEVVTSVISSIVSDDSGESLEENDNQTENHIIMEDNEMSDSVQFEDENLELIIDNDIEVVNHEVETILVDDNDDEDENSIEVEDTEQCEVFKDMSKLNQTNLTQPAVSVQRKQSISVRHEILGRRESDISSLGLSHDCFNVNEDTDSLSILSEVADSVLTLKKSAEEKQRNADKQNASSNVLFSGKMVPLNVTPNVSETKSPNSNNVVFSMCRKTNKRKMSSYSDSGSCHSIFNSISEELPENRYGIFNIENRSSKSPNCRETIRRSNSIMASPSTNKTYSRTHNEFIISNEINKNNLIEGENSSKETNRSRRLSIHEVAEKNSTGTHNNTSNINNLDDHVVNYQHQNHHQQTQQATLNNNQHKQNLTGLRCNNDINNCSIRVIEPAKTYYRNDESHLSSFCDAGMNTNNSTKHLNDFDSKVNSDLSVFNKNIQLGNLDSNNIATVRIRSPCELIACESDNNLQSQSPIGNDLFIPPNSNDSQFKSNNFIPSISPSQQLLTVNSSNLPEYNDNDSIIPSNSNDSYESTKCKDIYSNHTDFVPDIYNPFVRKEEGKISLPLKKRRKLSEYSDVFIKEEDDYVTVPTHFETKTEPQQGMCSSTSTSTNTPNNVNLLNCENISYPPTPMLSIANFEMLLSPEHHAQSRKTFKTPAELKEMAPVSLQTFNILPTQQQQQQTVVNILPSAQQTVSLNTSCSSSDLNSVNVGFTLNSRNDNNIPTVQTFVSPNIQYTFAPNQQYTYSIHHPQNQNQQFDIQNIINLSNYHMKQQHMQNFLHNSQLNMQAKQAVLVNDFNIPINLNVNSNGDNLNNCNKHSEMMNNHHMEKEKELNSATKRTASSSKSKRVDNTPVATTSNATNNRGRAKKVTNKGTDRITRSSNRTNIKKYKDDSNGGPADQKFSTSKKSRKPYGSRK